MEQLHRVAYMSRCMLPADDPEAFSGGIRSILKWSRGWNRKTGVTGALLFNAGHFAQVLEGPADAVMATLGHIVCDRRSRDLKLLESHRVETREFPSWAMAYTDGSQHGDVVLASLTEPLKTATGKALLNMLRHFTTADAEDEV